MGLVKLTYLQRHGRQILSDSSSAMVPSIYRPASSSPPQLSGNSQCRIGSGQTGPP